MGENITRDRKETEWVGVDLVSLGKGQVVGSCEHGH